jgi:hypothetical protein
MTDRLDPLTNGARESRSIGELLGDISDDL